MSTNTPRRVLVIADIHGNDVRLERLLASEVYASADHRVFLGDYLDGCGDNIATAQKMITEAARADVTLLRGNHEHDLCNFLSQLLRYSAGQGTMPNLPKKEDRTETLSALFSLYEQDPDAFTTLMKGIVTTYEESPDFVMIGKALFAHGGYYPDMMLARRYDAIRVADGVTTAELPESALRFTMYGAPHRPGFVDGNVPAGYTVYIGHHYGRSNQKTPWERDGVICLDTGCGKSADLPLTAAEIDTATGKIVATHTF